MLYIFIEWGASSCLNMLVANLIKTDWLQFRLMMYFFYTDMKAQVGR